MLKADGQPVTLTRLLGTQLIPVSLTLQARVTDYKPLEMIAGSGLQAGDSKAIISTTEINDAQWPGVVPPAQQQPGDPRVPRKGDRLDVAGKVRTVLAAEPVYVGNEIVRFNLTIR